MSKIRVEGLKYRYPDMDSLVLDDLSFEVEKGAFIGIVGENTAGKSTLCYALTGLVPHFFKGAYGGNVLIDNIDVKQSEISDVTSKAGLVFDQPFSQMTGSKTTVYEEIAFGLENSGVEREEMRIRIDNSLRLMDIEHLQNKNPYDLSGGQMQRVAIASVLAMKPDVIVLDEPTSQLDPQGSDEVFQVIAKLAESGITIIMAEHKLEKLAEYASKILLLHKGKQIAYGSPKEVFSRDDILEYGIAPPVYVRIAKALKLKNKAGFYPITLDGLKQQWNVGDE
ncbi:energy-coupling factor ABC transporter ATP-binding protein [Oceanobacillus chungangensis]|uniref:Cobalt ABC transporter ATP-binding protein n=1 Tax=Oceanobacillus chungangensis TaxID=1229152 RepID=A0A3D8PHU0_9BACI|nr:ABC transporter ATP-binding protein [Oceanobacillus chungangensis]RDW15650.1 cobalt ABC transporter ATP-binding protein [Oceanobacillus chungangensis]